MTIRAKTKRRVTFLLLGAVVLTSALVAFWTVRKARAEANYQEHRRDGIAASEAGDHVTAIGKLAYYLGRYDTDVDALRAFAKSRIHVEERNYAHIRHTLNAYRTIVELDPSDHESRRKLLEMYMQTGFGTEAVELADRILREEPKNIEAMNVKAAALGQSRRFHEALQVMQDATAIEPNRLDLHMRTLQLMRYMDRPAEDVIGYADQLRAAHPEDVRFTLLSAQARYMVGARTDLKPTLDKLVAEPLPAGDDVYVAVLVSLLDNMSMFEESLVTLDRAQQQSDKPVYRQAYVRRLFELGRFEDVMKVIGELDTADKESNSELLGMKAITLVRLDQPDKAKLIADALAERRGDNAAQGWSLFVTKIFMAEQKNARELVDDCKEVLEYMPTNPFAHYFLGEAYAKLGDAATAKEQFRKAWQYASTWVAPLTRLADLYAAEGQHEYAMQLSAMVIQRQPNSKAGAVNLAKAMYSRVVDGSSSEPEKVLSLVKQIQESLPGEPQTLPILVDLYLRTNDRAAALAEIDKLLAGEPAQSDTVYLQLAALSQQKDLGRDKALYEAYEKHFGVSPNLAMTQALQLLRAGKKDEARQLLAGYKDRYPNDIRWQIAWAKFLDLTQDDEAAQLWMALARANPTHVPLLSMVLESPAVQRERQFMDWAINQVKEQTGGEGNHWKVARARWLMTSDNRDRDLREATTLLEQVVREAPDHLNARIALSMCFRQANNLGGAIDQLRAANIIAGSSRPDVTMELARLLIIQGQHDEARQYVEAASRTDNLSPVHLRQLAAMFAQLNEPDRAVAMLESIKGEEGDAGAPNLLKAQLYRQQGKIKEAEAEYERLMAAKPDPRVIEAYSDFLASTQRLADAELLLAKLNEFQLAPPLREMIYAGFYTKYGTPEQALHWYHAAVRAAPQNEAAWRRLILYHMLREEFDPALTVAAQALQSVPGNQTFSMMTAQADLLRRASKSANLKPLVVSLVRDSSTEAAAFEALRVLDEALTQNQSSQEVLVRLRQLSDRYPRFMPLQTLLVNSYVAVGRYNEAQAVATRTMELLPMAPEPAEQAAKVFMQQRRYGEALSLAQQWRERSAANPIEADIVIADILLLQRQPAAALKQIDPYLTAALQSPADFPPVINIYTRAMIASNQIDKAEQVLKPLLPQAQGWRRVWMMLAANDIRDDKISADWLERVRLTIPQSSPTTVAETIDLANTYRTVGQRNDNKAIRSRGLDLLDRITINLDAPIAVLLTYASHLYDEGNAAKAREMYERVIRREPTNHIALNNLAVLLAELPSGSDLDHALAMVNQAVQAYPNVANYYDTLALVQARRGDHKSAVAALQRAVQLDPASVEWKLNLGHALVKDAQLDAARDILRQIEADPLGVETLTKKQRDRLQELRGLINGQAGVN